MNMEWRRTGILRGHAAGSFQGIVLCEEFTLMPEDSPEVPVGLPSYYERMAQTSPKLLMEIVTGKFPQGTAGSGGSRLG